METPILKLWSPDNGDDYALVQDLAAVTSDIEDAILNPPYIRLQRVNDATPVSTGHAFQIGPDNATNLVMDDNEIMARNAGNVSQLNLNIDGGRIVLGATTSDVLIRGRIDGTNYAYAESAGLVNSGSFPSGPGGEVRSVSVTFPAGRFTATPLVSLTVQSNAPQNRSLGVSDVSATGMTINQYSDTSTRSAVHWIAKQMTSSSGNG